MSTPIVSLVFFLTKSAYIMIKVEFLIYGDREKLESFFDFIVMVMIIGDD